MINFFNSLKLSFQQDWNMKRETELVFIVLLGNIWPVTLYEYYYTVPLSTSVQLVVRSDDYIYIWIKILLLFSMWLFIWIKNYLWRNMRKRRKYVITWLSESCEATNWNSPSHSPPGYPGHLVRVDHEESRKEDPILLDSYFHGTLLLYLKYGPSHHELAYHAVMYFVFAGHILSYLH
jgi:hypothetical protein